MVCSYFYSIEYSEQYIYASMTPMALKKQADLQVPDIQGASHAAKMNEEILTDKTSFQMYRDVLNLQRNAWDFAPQREAG